MSPPMTEPEALKACRFRVMRADNETVLTIERAIDKVMSDWVDDVGDHRFETRVQAETAMLTMLERGYSRPPRIAGWMA